MRNQRGPLSTWIGALILVAFTAPLRPADGQVYLTQQEALKLAFPDALSIDRKTLFLTDEQVETIQSSARAKVESKIVTYYVARGSEEVLGYAFFEMQIVRTMPITYMAVVAPDSSLRAVEILAFHEPQDYLPSERWLSQFEEKTFDDDLRVKRGIRNISGATLSAYSIAEGVRRVLATFAAAIPKETDS
ncbi:MAG: FMN-binding protein [Bacteroidota bacterium]